MLIGFAGYHTGVHPVDFQDHDPPSLARFGHSQDAIVNERKRNFCGFL